MIDPAEHDDLVTKLADHEVRFNLLPDFLEAENEDLQDFEWSEVKFDETSRASLPESRGIYAFTIHSSRPGLPNHSYIMYIGITGDTGSNNLRKRFSDYLRDEKAIVVKRPKVRRMLQKWSSVLYFQYVVVENEINGLHEIEERLNDLFQSPIVTQDFSAKVRAARGAFS